jgi:peroxiredoxin Q/BCP
VKKNDVAYDFTLLDQDGNERTLSTMLVDGPVVLFFYPRR